MEVGRSLRAAQGASWRPASACESSVAFPCPHAASRSPRAPPRAFRLLQPVEAPEMNFAISSEMTQVTRCARAPREEEGGVGRWWLCGAPGSPGRSGRRGDPPPARLPARVGRARWSGTFPRRGGDRRASAHRDGGPRDLARRTARKDALPEESGGRRGPRASFPRCQERVPAGDPGLSVLRLPAARAGGDAEPTSEHIGSRGLAWGGTESPVAVDRGVLCSSSTLPAFLAKRGEKEAGGARERLP